MASAFKAKFKKIAKRDYGNVKMTLSEKDLGEFPVMDFVFSNGSGGEVSCALWEKVGGFFCCEKGSG